MARFYADENFRRPVVEALRHLGHDVLTCQEAGRANQEIDDEDVLAEALAGGRIVLTQDRDDFKRLHRRGLPHCGIITCTYDPDAGALAPRVHRAIASEAPGGRWLINIVRPNPTPQAP